MTPSSALQLREELISAHTATTEARHDLDSCLNRRAPQPEALTQTCSSAHPQATDRNTS